MAGNTITSSPIDTTGADLIVIMSQLFNAVPAITDSYGNTWTPLTERVCAGSLIKGQLFYCHNPTVGAGHTFTSTGTGVYPSLCILALSGAAASTPFDVQNGASDLGLGLDAQDGSVTPSEDNEVVISGLVCGSVNTTYSIDQGFTISDQVPWTTGACDGVALAYLIQTAAAAKNPTWTLGTDQNKAVVLATFKAAAGGGGGPIAQAMHNFRQRRS